MRTEMRVTDGTFGEGKVKPLSTATLIVAIAAVFTTQASNVAHASTVTYDLTLTDTGNPTYSGTGTLIISGAPASSGTDSFCGSNACGGGTVDSLTFTIDGFHFSSADSGASSGGALQANFTNGVLTSLGFGDTVGGNDQLQIPYSGGLTYSFNQYNGPSVFTTGTITDSLAAATPLPAALPLFAAGLGALGLFGWRGKRKAAGTAA
jgi:hypothetical protein